MISIVLPEYNDFINFKITFQSIINQVVNKDQIIIVDSSNDSEIIKNYLFKNKFTNVVYFWIQPKGVYQAQNFGINASINNWILIVNSGDRLLDGAIKLIKNNINLYPNISIHIYAQLSGINNVESLTFYPNNTSVWPHQSLIVSSSVYNNYGIYNEKLKVTSEQIYFAEIRKKANYKIYNKCISYYDLNGLSSKLSFSNMKEYYNLWILLDHGIMKATIKAFIIPIIKGIMIKVLPYNIVLFIKSKYNKKLYSRNIL